MNILLIGTSHNLEEAKLKFGEGHSYILDKEGKDEVSRNDKIDVIFDFFGHEGEMKVMRYEKVISPVIFIDTTVHQLRDCISPTNPNVVFGFCGMPSFLNREQLEVVLYKQEHLDDLKRICSTLHTGYQVVADRVGLVTPRVICMIINEAFCTVEEGIATREDIDLAMKLGTNYPYGPFEWCERIGARQVIQLLDAVYNDTQDARYKVCSLLRQA